ncbi:tryptophan 7-halogenase [Ideonella azotifigens]|uniref:tryptophan 7-halogenase n=1 Tax=Ideonella azotifigens TaxID=513160 RepID=UPI001E4C52BB|nr:tryptophan 7-halogenase [Ideonella azotifigens]MCD2339448.1 tryptophan 7-halogenase [Ideonella azotifigens]
MTPLDVLICGAGPAGCATALALRQAGVRDVGLVDWPLARPWAIGESATPDVGTMLSRLGLPGAMQAHAPYQANLSLWGEQRQIDDFLHRGQGSGWHLDRQAFDTMLREAAVAQGVRLMRPAKIDQLAWQGASWALRLNDGSTWRPRVLVDASGRRAELATRLGATRRQVDALVALGAIVPRPAAGGLAGLSLIEPVSFGWWYAAPLAGERAVVCLMTDRDLAQAHRLRSGDPFRQAWCDTEELVRRLPPPANALRIASFPAHSTCLDRATGPGWMAVGDALMAFDPLTSSGISGALADGLAAADTLAAWLAGQPMVPSGRAWAQRADTSWRRYLEQRRMHYAAERRWPDSPFWSARQTAPPPDPRPANSPRFE